MEEKDYFTLNLSPLNTFLAGIILGIILTSLFSFYFYFYQLSPRAEKTADQAQAQNSADQDAAAKADPSQHDPEELAKNLPPVDQDDNVKGPNNAKISFIIYDDFECPYCLKFEPTLNKIEEKYGDQIQFVFRHFPLNSIHAHAQKAHEASECAAEQGKFWPMHQKIYQANEAGDMSVSVLKSAAEEIGLNITSFNSCLEKGKYVDKIKQDQKEGQEAGVRGTPAWFINGVPYSGYLDFSSMDKIIQSYL